MRPRQLTFGVGLVLAGVIGVVACTATNEATNGTRCTPKNYVYCRCEDRSEGTKLCLEDGASFDPCKCEGNEDPFTSGDPDAGLEGGPLVGIDSGPLPEGPTIDAKCVGRLGLVAGSTDDLDAYVATYTGAGAFAVSRSSGPGLRGPVSVVPVGSTLVAAYPSRYSLLAWAKLAAGVWSPPNSIGSAMTASAPSATLLNGQLKLFYLGIDDHFHTGSYAAAGGWDDATALAETTNGTAPAPGLSGPGVAVVGSSITLAYSGDDGMLARETFSSGNWSSAVKFSGPGSYDVAPTVVALDAGGTKDMLLVYTGADTVLRATTREASNKAWNVVTLVDTAASSTETTLAAISGGKALLVYKGSNGQGYYSVWTPGTGFSLPAELVPGKNPALASVPSITRGQCGSDATIAYAEAGGAVKIVRLSGTTMTGPFVVGGISRATYVGVGELP